MRYKTPNKKPKSRIKPKYTGRKHALRKTRVRDALDLSSIKPSIHIPMRPSLKPRSPKLIRAIHSPANMIMFHGPRNTSKSYSHWKTFAAYHELIPGLQSFIVRNEAKTLAKTVIKTFLRMLKHPSAKDPRNPFEIVGGINFPQRILWANGGVTELGGLDDPDKILGGDYHMGWYNEVQREKREESFSNLLGCFVGDRAGPLPSWVPWRYRMYMDGNPTSPAHFIYRRKAEQEELPIHERILHWYNVLHKDNPMLSKYDDFGNFLGLNERGKNNEKDLLDAYPAGYMRDRMVYGIPRGAEGMVYPMWDPKKHVKLMDMSWFPRNKTIWRWSIDIGGRDPHAIGIFAQVGDRHHLYKEIIKSNVEIREIIIMAEQLCAREGIPKPSAVFIDHNVVDFRLQLEAKGYPVVPADKETILTGVESLREAITDNNFWVNRDSVEERDPLLGTRPIGFKEECPSYAHKPEEKRTGSIKDDEPDPTIREKHSVDLARYYIHSLYLAPIPYGINYSESYTLTEEEIEEDDYISGLPEAHLASTTGAAIGGYFDTF